MANAKADKIKAKLATKGKTATVTWPSKSLNSLNGAASTQRLPCVFEKGDASPTGYVAKAYLPATSRPLQGATIEINQTKYKVVDTVSYYDGEEVILQEAILA